MSSIRQDQKPPKMLAKMSTWPNLRNDHDQNKMYNFALDVRDEGPSDH